MVDFPSSHSSSALEVSEISFPTYPLPVRHYDKDPSFVAR